MQQVPVGGAVVASPSAAFIEALAKTYPGVTPPTLITSCTTSQLTIIVEHEQVVQAWPQFLTSS